MVVGSLDRVALGMRELSLNYIRCPALLVEHGRCHSAKPVCRERRAVVAQAAKRSVDRVLAHRFAIRANAREDPWAAIGQGPQIYQDPDHLSRQRHDVHDAALHLRGGDSPLGLVEVDFDPLGPEELTGSHERHRGERVVVVCHGGIIGASFMAHFVAKVPS